MRREFVAAWVFLVVVVAFGFYVQARTIDSLHETQEIQRRLLVAFERQQEKSVRALCDLTFTLHPDEVEEARRLFETYGITCP